MADGDRSSAACTLRETEPSGNKKAASPEAALHYGSGQGLSLHSSQVAFQLRHGAPESLVHAVLHRDEGTDLTVCSVDRLALEQQRGDAVFFRQNDLHQHFLRHIDALEGGFDDLAFFVGKGVDPAYAVGPVDGLVTEEPVMDLLPFHFVVKTAARPEVEGNDIDGRLYRAPPACQRFSGGKGIEHQFLWCPEAAAKCE